MGRHRSPKLRNAANAEIICARLAQGHSLRQIGSELGVAESSIREWALDDGEFASRYARAMDLRTERFADEILEICDDGTNDWIERNLGGGETITVADHEHIQRSRLRVDARKWLMSKMMPRKYGDQLQVGGLGGGPVVIQSVKYDAEDK